MGVVDYMKPSSEQFIRLDYMILCYKRLHIWERVILAFLVGLDKSGKYFFGNMSYFEEAGLSASDCFRIFSKLEDLGFVYRASDGSYRLSDITTLYKILEEDR